MAEHRIDMTADPAEVERTMAAFNGLTDAQRHNLVRNVVEVVLTYKAEGDDPAVLRQFAEDVLASAELHSMPSYQGAFAPSRA